jgi:hypothetical protein
MRTSQLYTSTSRDRVPACPSRPRSARPRVPAGCSPAGSGNIEMTFRADEFACLLALLIPRIVSTSSCSTLSLAFHKKSVREVNSICRSRMWKKMTTTVRTSALFASSGIARNLNNLFQGRDRRMSATHVLVIVVVLEEFHVAVQNDMNYHRRDHQQQLQDESHPEEDRNGRQRQSRVVQIRLQHTESVTFAIRQLHPLITGTYSMV